MDDVTYGRLFIGEHGLDDIETETDENINMDTTQKIKCGKCESGGRLAKANHKTKVVLELNNKPVIVG